MGRAPTEEERLWRAVIATVRPLRPARPVAAVPILSPPLPAKLPEPALQARTPKASRLPTPAPPPPSLKPAPNTLDGSWDRRLARGLVSPDSAIDLHGYNLAAAHALLDDGLSDAIARADRVLLLVTGKPPRPESERPHARGAIRAAVADWLAASRHADRIAAVRAAHPRHGGAGALYIVLRRPRIPT